MSSEKIIGIDLGTTYSCVSYIDEFGKPVVIPNSDGDFTTPSVVFFEDEENIVVGKQAKNLSNLYPDRVVEFVKRNMGNPNYTFDVDGKSYRPEEISAYILYKIVKDASQNLGEDITDVIITCPAYFGINEREATKNAGEIAGLKVLIQETVETKKPEQSLDPVIRRKIRTNLAVLQKRNLFEFLEIHRGISKAELEKVCQEAQTEWNKKKNDDKKVAANNLLWIVKQNILKEGLEKYERALIWDIIDDQLKPQIEFAAMDKKISREEFEMLVKNGIKFGLSKEQATEAIFWLAQEKGAVIEFFERTNY